MGEQKGAKEAINEFFNGFGVNAARVDEVAGLRRKIEYLTELYEDRTALRADHRWVRPLRESSNNATKKIGQLLMLSAMGGVGTAFFLGARAMMIKWLGTP